MAAGAREILKSKYRKITVICPKTSDRTLVPWKRKPKVCSVIYDFQFKPKKLLSELCKCRKRAEFLKMDHVFPGDDPDNFRFENWADPPSSEDEHHHGHRLTKPRVSMSTDGLEYEMGLFAPTVPQVSAVRE